MPNGPQQIGRAARRWAERIPFDATDPIAKTSPYQMATELEAFSYSTDSSSKPPGVDELDWRNDCRAALSRRISRIALGPSSRAQKPKRWWRVYLQALAAATKQCLQEGTTDANWPVSYAWNIADETMARLQALDEIDQEKPVKKRRIVQLVTSGGSSRCEDV